MIYITGAARSGTKFLADALTAAGVNATHEAAQLHPSGRGFEFITDEAGDIEVSSDGAYRVADIARRPEMNAIGHVIRRPKPVVASIVGRGMFGEPWGTRRSYEWPALGIQNLPPIDRALLYWITVNQWIDARGDDHSAPIVQFRLDRPAGALLTLCRLEGLDVSLEAIQAGLDATSKTTNRREDRPPIEYRWDAHDSHLQHIATVMAMGYELGGIE